MSERKKPFSTEESLGIEKRVYTLHSGDGDTAILHIDPLSLMGQGEAFLLEANMRHYGLWNRCIKVTREDGSTAWQRTMQ